MITLLCNNDFIYDDKYYFSSSIEERNEKIIEIFSKKGFIL